MSNAVSINDRFELVTEVCENDSPVPEIVTYIREKATGIVWQDICLVRPAEIGDKVEALVWSDKDDEDYTHKFTIDLYEEDEANTNET